MSVERTEIVAEHEHPNTTKKTPARARAHTQRRKTRARNTRPRRETLAKTGGGRDCLRDYSILHHVTGSGVYIERSGARGRRGGGHLSPPPPPADRYDARAKHPLTVPPARHRGFPRRRLTHAPSWFILPLLYTRVYVYIYTCTLCTWANVYNVYIYNIIRIICVYVGRGETPRVVWRGGFQRWTWGVGYRRQRGVTATAQYFIGRQ